MNRLPIRTRAQILSLLVEGMSLQSIGRHTGVSITTVTKLMMDAGDACARLHDRRVTGVAARHVECDELKTFCYAKEENLSTVKAAPAGAGDVWIWTALDRDSDLMLAWRVGGRTKEDAERFAFDLAGRLADRPQLFTDGHEDYEKALKKAFGESLDHGQIVKTYDERTGEAVTFRKRIAAGRPAWKDISTGRVERRNLDMRTRISRLHRRAITYSKRTEKLRAISLPLMGIGNYARSILAGCKSRLITPHGDWKRWWGCHGAPGRIAHYPSWGLETLEWINGDGYRHNLSLPLMGIGNQQRPRKNATAANAHYPSWGLETPIERQMVELNDQLITPHGDWKLHLRGRRQGDTLRLITPHGDWKHAPPVADASQGHQLITPHGDWKRIRRRSDPGGVAILITPHGDWKRARKPSTRPGESGSLPLMGIGNPSRSLATCSSSQTHYPSWGLETRHAQRRAAQDGELITPHGDWKHRW